MAKKHIQTCAVAEFLNIFGDAWSLLIIREAFYGATRFNDFRQNTGAAKNILSDRLNMLVQEGIFRQVDIGERGVRYEYQLTERGESLFPIIVTINQWSNDHVFGKGGEPIQLYERSSGKKLLKLSPRDRDGKVLQSSDVFAKAGPGANAATRKRISEIPAP